MKMYKLIIPSGNQEISIGMKYGNITLKNGQVLPESDVVLSYPHLFHLIPESSNTPVDIAPQMIEPVLSDATPKRKAGRPKKIF